ncbi:MAG: NAD(P)H-dependent glycerol-3-phosphate dehydrogenase, partial [Kiritimatiellia bacterium]|nr:NAD(P)H-dependent glycerol-3-phosphate dehydrogenase [Kiritimatiellia bacterium]
PAIPEEMVWSADRREAVQGVEYMVWAIPSRYFRDAVKSFRSDWTPDALHVSVSKGLDPGSLSRLTEVVEHEWNCGPVTALSGPTFADEVARGLPAAAVAASRDPGRARAAQRLFGGESFRVYTSEDVTGVEIGGALKNVVALAAGVCDGIGAGANARAALITRGLAELARLGMALGGRRETFAGLSGMGDLVLTCTGSLSRNRRVGERIGAGERLEAVLQGMDQVAEGVTTCGSARTLAAQTGIEMPIVEAVHAVLYENKDPCQAVAELMGRSPRPESDGE